MKDLQTRTIRATGWVFGSQFFSQAISLGFGIALARMLLPDDFGLVAMVVVFTGFAGLLSDIGLGSALIQKQDVEDIHFNSVFWLNLLLGFVSMLVLYLLAHPISSFYERTEVEAICKALAITFPIGALTLVPRTRLAKELLFKQLGVCDTVALIVSGGIAVYMAASGKGYWSLVVLALAKPLISMVLIWGVSSWRPSLSFDFDALRGLFGFSSSVLGTRILQYMANNVDKLLLAKFLNSQAVGIYDKAHAMMLFPLQNISRVIGQVMFPSFSLIQVDTERVKSIYLRSTRAISLLTFPMMTGMFVVADSFVLGVLGPQWAELIPVLRILCIAGIMTSIVTVTGALYLSQGAAGLQLRVNLITQPIRIVLVAVGLFWGVLGVATGYLVAMLATSIITLTVAGGLINLRLSTLVRTLLPTLMPALAMGVFVWLIRPISGIQHELTLFLIQAFAGSLIYLILVVSMRLEAYTDVKDTILQEFGRQ